ncbi:NHS-like protein 3 isoform X1 [Labrus bergylta]|uniref:NHS-like protein 3 isoform X1 n=1 Tax=Labrus bergylta TaxID=56723 RepID=UPI00331416E6
MSRRRSTGDLVPKEITEILAREARVQRGQKKSGSSLGHAFSWFRGSKKKKSVGNGINRAVIGSTDAKLGLQNHEPAKAGLKGNEDQKRLTVHYTTSQHYQENVFIEGSRPQYLEDLHTEAQEGLKILQQEEHRNGVNFPDNESIASTDTLRLEHDISSKDGGFSLESRSTAGSTDTTVTSAVSTRPVLTRQGSTFKPLNPVKRLDRSRKRSRRTTIMGIPNQVQKELALHRTSTFQQLVSTQTLDQDGEDRNSQSGVVIIPTVDGGTPLTNKEGARVHLSDVFEQDASRDEQLLRKHLRAMNQDEQPFNHQGFGSYHGPTSNLRPKSLAVPGMTTSFTFSSSTMLSFLQEPQGPVMSISPQATYLSTIIPNAVLPASFDVIEIDRSSSRTRGSGVNHSGSVRTVSKSSLASGDSSVSPLLSRRSDGDGSQADDFHNDSTRMPISDSGSNWSKSQSSKTIISHSSPVSSKGSTRSAKSQRVGLNGQDSQGEHSGGDNDLVSLHSSVSMSSSKSENVFAGQGCESGISESVVTGEDGKTNQNFTRSLSVMKTKQPPAPPRRTNSLHSNRIRSNSRVLVDCKDLNESLSLKMAENTVAKDTITSMDTTKSPIPISNSTGSISLNASNSPLSPTQASSNVAEKAPEPKSECTNSSPQKTPSEGGKFERTMSPSSGYSSQSGTPTLSPKGISPTSPEKPKKTPVKPDRSVSRASSSAASPSSSLTSLSSGTSESVNLHTSTCSPSPHPQGSSPDVAAKELTPNNSSSTLGVEVRQLLNIPQPPKVKAPCPPPPETWVHNRRSFELLCGPSPTISKGTQIPAETQVSSVKQAGTQTEVSNEMQELVKKQSTVDISVLEASESTAKPETLLETASDIVHKELENRDYPDIQQDATDACVDTQTQEQSSSPVVKLPESQETTPKKEPPPVMTKPVTVLHREILASKEPLMNGEQSQMSCSAKSEVDEPVKNTTIQSLDGVPALVDKRDNETDDKEVKPMQTLTVDVPKISKISPPPSPPPAYHPTPPLSRKTPTSSVSMAPEDLEKVEEESHVIESCWPPPPPPMEGDSVFDGGEEVEFPPPPPPFVAETVPKGMTKLDLSKRHTEEMVETVEDSSEAGASVHEQTPDVLPSVPQAFTDIKPEVGVQVSKDSTCDEISCRQEQNILPVSDKAQPVPPVDVPILEPITTVENTAPVSALMSSSSSQNRLSLKIENQSPSEPPVSTQPPVTIPVAPPLPAENLTHGVNFRRQPSVANRDTRSKELLSRHKSAPIPKEDANIPLVTPSLLQMVRLRSVNMTDDLVKAPTEDKSTNQGVPALENSTDLTPGPQNIPQKPIRKSLSLKSPPKTAQTSPVALSTPSMRLQEAIRMKTAAMSSRDGLPSRLGVRSSTYSYVSEQSALSQRSPDVNDMHKSPATTASFIFSRSTKKVVIETAAASCPEAQASLKESLAAELMQMSDQSKAVALSNGGVKSDKVPPPVAKKPAHGSLSPSRNDPACSAMMDVSVGGNGAIGVRNASGVTYAETTTTRVTADTIETLF